MDDEGGAASVKRKGWMGQVKESQRCTGAGFKFRADCNKVGR